MGPGLRAYRNPRASKPRIANPFMAAFILGTGSGHLQTQGNRTRKETRHQYTRQNPCIPKRGLSEKIVDKNDLETVAHAA